MLDLTVGLMFKDEMGALSQWLEFVKSLEPKEIIAIDDYSTDKSPEFLESEGVTVLRNHKTDTSQGWAVLRNLINKLATGKWILQLDADELLSKEAKEILTERLEDISVRMYWLKRIHLVEDENHCLPVGSYDIQARLYRNLKEMEWRRPIHEILCYQGVGVPQNVGEFPVLDKPAILHYKFLKSPEALVQWAKRWEPVLWESAKAGINLRPVIEEVLKSKGRKFGELPILQEVPEQFKRR